MQLNTTAETAALLEAAIGENTAKIGTINTTLETHAANIGKNTKDITGILGEI